MEGVGRRDEGVFRKCIKMKYSIEDYIFTFNGNNLLKTEEQEIVL